MSDFPGDILVSYQTLDVPDDASAMIICPGRWYYGLGLLNIEACPGTAFVHGGDMIFMLWRHAHQPSNWVIQFRFRRNAAKNSSPWEGVDKKAWFCERLPGLPKEAAIQMIRNVIQRTAASEKDTGLEMGAPDWLIIEGDWRAFLRVAAAQKKPWMQIRAGNLPPEDWDPLKPTS